MGWLLHGYFGAVDYSAFTCVALVLLAGALPASYLPARHAAAIEPTEVLRME
jgi:ABC-type lipoprotein release transport system permease subunit